MGKTKEMFNQEREYESRTDDIYMLCNGVLDGEIDALSAYVALKEFEKDIRYAIEKVQPKALESAKDYGETSFSAYGAKISVKQGAGRWNFSHIPMYNDAKDNLKKVEDLAKQAYSSKSMGMEVVDENGEIIEPAEYTEGNETISVTIK